MRHLAVASLLTVTLLSIVASAVAQPGVDIKTTPPARPEARPPTPERTHPGDAAYAGRRPQVNYDPMFLGPTLRRGGTELGFSAWIAPNDPVGGPKPGDGEVTGWAALGLTFSWGGPPARPSGGPAIR
jgi:hypothetical protein